jgi:hypothetical protein
MDNPLPKEIQARHPLRVRDRYGYIDGTGRMREAKARPAGIGGSPGHAARAATTAGSPTIGSAGPSVVPDLCSAPGRPLLETAHPHGDRTARRLR